MSEQTTSFADELFGVLQHVHTAFERHGIWHCLLFGTLLGAIRDGDIIAWDHDIDLLIRPVDLPHVLGLNSELRHEGLEFWAGRSPAGRLALNPGDVPWFNPAHVDIIRPQGCRGELYAPTLFADGVLRLYDFEHEVARWPQSSFPIFAVEGERTALVRGQPFPVPLHAEDLLEWHYGPGWRTPYRSVFDGGTPRKGLTPHGDLAAPDLTAQIDWCEDQGWDRSRYVGHPAWPRPLAAAGPADGSPRTTETSGSAWWHTLDELSNHH